MKKFLILTYLSTALSAFILFLVASPVLCAQERTWESLTGEHKMRDSLVEVTERGALLLKVDGTTQPIPLDKLSMRERRQ